MTALRPPYLVIAVAAVAGALSAATLPASAPGWVIGGSVLGILLAWRLTPAGRLPAVLRRGALVGPFILFLAGIELFRGPAGATVEIAGLVLPLGPVRAADVLLKTFTAVCIGLAWGERVGAHGIARTLHRARAPAAAVAVTFLTVNFLSTLAREWESVRLAARARGLNRASYAIRLRQLGASLMSVLVRSMWRGERIAFAMRARGYSGYLPVPITGAKPVGTAHLLMLTVAVGLTAVAVLARMTP
jgi:cobalt/nickel transport system permease protein